MTLSEARGYARARARMAVAAEIDLLSRTDDVVPAASCGELVEQALEYVVGRIIAQRMVDAPVALPVRRAA
ncbi:MAG TPA: hypothetical protein VHX65_16655 [Pirellulales bacterium]|nr:hypothetical protein [Pirellulales bacterium]